MGKVQSSHTHQRKTEYNDLKEIPAFERNGGEAH